MTADPTVPGLDEFLNDQPFISIKPSRGTATVLEGEFRFKAQAEGLPPIEDTYELRIEVPANFPRNLPVVHEVGRRIPRVPNFHNGSEGLCLGSPIRLMSTLQSTPTLAEFSRKCIVPYLYAMSATINGQRFVFGELAHGTEGELEDCRVMLGLKSTAVVVAALEAIVTKKRVANKMTCPCGCRKRLGRCRFNETIRDLRVRLPKPFVRERLKAIKTRLGS